MPRRRMLAIGTSRYQDKEFENLEKVPDAVKTMVGTFDALGFETRSLMNPSKSKCEKAIESWLHDVDWAEDDLAVLYLTGHGISAAGGHYLAMKNTAAERYAKAVETRFISRALGNDPSLCHLLVLLDTCFSESGGDTMVDLAQSMKQEWSQRNDRRYMVVSSSRSKQEAQQLVFAKAFQQALTRLRGSSGTQSPFIPLVSVVSMTNVILAEQPITVTQRATYATLVPVSGEDNFFDNPTYAGGYTVEIPPELVPANELHSHWLPRARGGADDQAPSLFQGRERLMDEITTWGSDTGQPSLLVVTGAPGTGKSALIAQFVVPRGSSHGTPPAGGRVPLARAVYAHGLTAEAIRQRVEDLLQPDTSTPGKRPVVIIDALDEAVDTANLEAVVLKPLIAAGALVAVGARPALVKSFETNRVVIDLDHRGEPADVTAYVAGVLAAEPGSPYKPNEKPTHNVAAAVAALSGSNFLLAGQIARTLARMDRPLKASEIANDVRSFGSLANVFEADLRRISDDTGVVRELLTALAWSQGAGLPWEGIWPAVSSALFSPRTYNDDDVRRTLDSASDYVVEMLFEGRSHYRLYHELFAEHLRRGTIGPVAHARITHALISATPTDEHGKRDWENAHPYVLENLAAHAAQGDKLEGLLQDPRAALALNPERLHVALGAIASRPIGINESAVLRYLENLPAQVEHRMSQLALAALQSGATYLAARAGDLASRPAWWPQWVRWAAMPAHTVVTRLRAGVTAIGVVEYEAEALAIAASEAGDVACSGISTGRQVWHRIFDRVSALAAADGLVAVGTGPGPIYILAAPDGHEVAVLPGQDPSFHSSTSALAIHVQGAEILVAAGSYNEDTEDNDHTWGGKLRLWNLDEPDHPKWTRLAFRAGVRTLGFRSADEGLQLVAGGDPHREPKTTRAVARIFDAVSGEMRHQTPPDLGVWASAVACPDGSVLVIPVGSDSPVVRWNPNTGETLTEIGYNKNGVSSLSPDGSVWLVGTYTNLLALSPATLQPLHKNMTNGVITTALAFSISGERTFVLSGSQSGEVTRWDLAALTAPDHDRPRPRIPRITTNGRDLVTYSVDDGSAAVETARLSNGEVIARTEQVFATALHSMGSSGVVYVGHDSGEVDVLDASTLEVRWPTLLLHDGGVWGITDADGLLITWGRDAEIRVTNPQNGRVWPPLVHADYKKRLLVQVRVIEFDGGPGVVALDYSGELVLWRWKEVLKGAVDVFEEDGRNAAKKFYVWASNTRANTFCAWRSPEETLFIRPGREGAVETWSNRGDRKEWPAHDTEITHVEMLGHDVLLTAGWGGLLRAWRLPERRLIAEVGLGASIISLYPVDQRAVLVGTDSGLALLNLTSAGDG